SREHGSSDRRLTSLVHRTPRRQHRTKRTRIAISDPDPAERPTVPLNSVDDLTAATIQSDPHPLAGHRLTGPTRSLSNIQPPAESLPQLRRPHSNHGHPRSPLLEPDPFPRQQLLLGVFLQRKLGVIGASYLSGDTVLPTKNKHHRLEPRLNSRNATFGVEQHPQVVELTDRI